MKTIFLKKEFPIAPGGNIYHWKDADTKFEVYKNGKYIIEITAVAKNAEQSNSIDDDDDLRVSLDEYTFGKYEIHDEKISWKGFGTASAWDGASLKGCQKTIYFFVECQKGWHHIRFFADGTPVIKKLEVFKFGVNEEFSINASLKSSKQNSSNDGDNLKVVLNGKIIKNKNTATSRKYKNFYFAGDFSRGVNEMLYIQAGQFVFLENSIELWYDKAPSISVSIRLFDSFRTWLENSIPKNLQLKLYKNTLDALVEVFSLLKYKYTRDFLKNSLSTNPKKLFYDKNSSIVHKIKKDEAYKKLLLLVEQQIRAGELSGQLLLGDDAAGLKIDFESGDLKFSLHGIKKLEYSAVRNKNNIYTVNMFLYDIYDFDAGGYRINPIWIPVHIADVLEDNLMLRNFEIEINITDKIKVPNA
ncbi:MAG: hypothetical protein AAB592_00700 [Patescibacteria group bacterium]